MNRSRVFFFVTSVVCAFAGSGCLSPALRYTANGAPRATPNHYIVSRTWDYREFYKVPRDRLKVIVDSYLGVPYRYGGGSVRGMDCSGFVKVVFTRLNHARLPRTTRGLFGIGKPVTRAKAVPGDLVFFRGGMFNRVNHVGIYFENGRFAHASSSKGVIYSNLDEDYYHKRLAGIRRLF